MSRGPAGPGGRYGRCVFTSVTDPGVPAPEAEAGRADVRSGCETPVQEDDVNERDGARRPETPGGGPGGEAGFGLAEALVAIMVMAVGLLAVAGITLAVAQQSRASSYTTEQTMVGQEMLEFQLDQGYAGLTPGTSDTAVQVDSRTYDVEVTVSDVGPRTRRVDLSIAGQENTSPVTLSSLVHRPRSVPEEYVP